MDHNEEIFAEELQRTLQWISKNPKEWVRMNDSYPNENTPEEIAATVDTLMKERLYIPLVLYLSNDFVSYKGADLMRRIAVEVLLGQWSQKTWDNAVKAIQKTIAVYL